MSKKVKLSIKNNKNINKKSNAISSKILASLPDDNAPIALLTLDEVEKIFPKVDASNNVQNKEKENKDYTVIRQENGKLRDLLRYKLQYDLLVWQVFFEKCHEVENSFFIQDDNLEKAIRNNSNNIEDITTRDIKYKRQNKTYSELLIDEFNKNRYNEYVKSMTGEDQEVEEVIKKNRFGLLIVSIIFVIFAIVSMFINFDFLKINFEYLSYCITASLALVSLVFLILFVFNKKVYRVKKYQAKVRPHMSYEEWKEKNCVSDEYNSRIVSIKKSYIEVLKLEENKLISYVEVMKDIKQRMMEIIPLYKDFYTEDKVNYLLNPVIDRKCDTIRKTVRLAKEKEYQVDYLSSLGRLAKSFNYIEDFKVYIQEYNNLSIEKREEFDNSIEKDNQILRYLNRIHLPVVKIDNDPFIIDKNK